MTPKISPVPWVVLLVIVLITGCGDDDGGVRPNSEPTLSQVTFPLAVGNTWTYEADTDTTSLKANETDTSRIVGTQTKDGQTYYVLENVTSDGPNRALVRQAGQEILISPVIEVITQKDPFQEWMDQIMTASLPWKMADFDADEGGRWIEIDAEADFTLDGSDVTVRYEVHGKSLGRSSVSIPMDNYTDVYHGEFTTRLTLSDPAGDLISAMATVQQFWIADGVGMIKEVLASSAEMEGEGYTITKTSELSDYTLE